MGSVVGSADALSACDGSLRRNRELLPHLEILLGGALVGREDLLPVLVRAVVLPRDRGRGLTL